MTTSPNADNPDTEGKTVPPYDGRRETADVDGQAESTKDGVKTAGATGPVEDDKPKAPDPEDTERGEHASPTDEQPASESTDTDTDPDMTGPSHEPGTGRAEDKS
jgi:hypothetical protein